MQTETVTRPLSVFFLLGIVVLGGCDTLPRGDATLPPITDVIAVLDAVFADAPLPESDGPGDAPAADPPMIRARWDQAFRLDTEKIGEPGVAQVAIALEGYSGHILFDADWDDDDNQFTVDFRTKVTTGQFTWRVVLIADDGTAGDPASGTFTVENRQFSETQWWAVQAGFNAPQTFMFATSLLQQGILAQAELDVDNLTEISTGGCPSLVARRESVTSDAVDFAWSIPDPCLDDDPTGTLIGTGSIAGQSADVSIDLSSQEFTVTGTVEGRRIKMDDTVATSESNVDVVLGSSATTGAGTLVYPADQGGTVRVTFASVTGEHADLGAGVETTFGIEGLVWEDLEGFAGFTSGTVSLTIASDTDKGSVVQITYKEDSPATETVLVSIDGRTPFEYLSP